MRQTCLLRLAISREEFSWGQLSGVCRRDGAMVGLGCDAYTCTSREGLVLSALLGVPPVVEAPWLVRQGDQMQPISFHGNSSWRRQSAVLSVLVP